MNTPIRRVFFVVVVLFGLLAFYTARWTVIDQNSLRQNALNNFPALHELRHPRGEILTSSGRTIARSVKVGGKDGTYVRRYPQGSLFARPVGYSYVTRGSTGLEKYYDDRLVGRDDEFKSALDQLLGRGDEPETMITNLNRSAQKLASGLMQGRPGAVVVIDPKTGRIPVWVSSPTYNPAALNSDAGTKRLNTDTKGAPLFDRVSRAAYPPGSTFKVITAAAALDTGLYTPDSLINGDSPKTFSGKPLENDLGESFGDIPLSKALVQSVNTVFAQVGEKLGSKTLLTYMKKFGFYQPSPVDLPSDEISSSGLRDPKTGDLLPANAGLDLGRVAIGQERLSVTPLQMAEVAATVANGGERVAPHIAKSFTDKYGRVLHTVSAKNVKRVMSATTALELNKMMRSVVEEGTGRPAEIAGLDLAGKTGTAEVPATPAGNHQAWFIGFAPATHPRYAIAVTIERTPGFGGSVAAPIASQVLKNLLGQ